MHELNNPKPYFEIIHLKNITNDLFQHAINDLQKKYARSTLEGIYVTAKMVFAKAAELEVLKEDATRYSYFPKYTKTYEEIEEEESIPNFMEKEELSLFLKTCKKEGLEIDFEIFLTLSYTGLLVGEFCALKENDIIEDDGYALSITKTIYNPKNIIQDYELGTPKNKTSRRIIDIDDLIYRSLKRVIEKNEEMNEEMKDSLQSEYYDNNFIFINTNKYPGYPLYPKFVQNRMSRILHLANLNNSLTPHSLRHTHTSLLSEAGVSLERIMNRLGHANDTITKEIYLHTTKAVRQRGSLKFGALMDQVIDFETQDN